MCLQSSNDICEMTKTLINKILEAARGETRWKFISLFLRFALMIVVAVLYFTNSHLLEYPIHFFEKSLPLHALWLFFLCFFSARLFGNKHAIMASNRKFAKYNDIEKDYSKEKLLDFVKKNNIRAIWVILLALVVNLPFWALYYFGVIDERFLFSVFIVYFFLDIVCETLFCPLQKIILKNRCCHVCRIYSWNTILTIAPILVIPGFFSASLMVIGIVDLIYFEIKYKSHPEYFWDGSNSALRCNNCYMKMCAVRGKL